MLALAFLLRAAAAWHWRGELTNDRDGYRAIAENLLKDRGFSSDGEHPTAFRPPLYPLLLAVVSVVGDQWGVAAGQVLLGVGTVWLTFLIGRNLGMGRGAVAAAGLVAVDPLLLRYTPQLMTETLFAFLVALLCCWYTGFSRPESSMNPEARLGRLKPGHQRAALVGLAFGLCALCRPTIWAFGVMGGAGWVVGNWWCVRNRKRWIGEGLVAVCVCGVVVSPWVVRNFLVFHRPIVMTTHGGYTQLLGNNPVFYDEVVRKPSGSVWKGDSLHRWQKSLESDMRTAEPPPVSEPARDRWHRERAIQNIRNDPSGFAAACWLRFRRFWNVAPVADAASFRTAAGSGGYVAAVLSWGVAAFYTLVTIGLLAGLYRLRRREWRRWWPLVALLVSFTAVHLLYWANTRMRAPLVPAIALLCIRGGKVESRKTDE